MGRLLTRTPHCDAPRAVPDFNGLNHTVRSRVDHRDIVGEAVGGVDFLAVGRDGQPPDALPRGDVRQYLESLGVENHAAVPPAGGDVDAPAVAGDDDSHRLDVAIT